METAVEKALQTGKIRPIAKENWLDTQIWEMNPRSNDCLEDVVARASSSQSLDLGFISPN